jgi:hypothetical protein
MIWRAGCALRVALTLLGSGYIHPDEHFQSVEIASRDIHNITAFTPWEFGGGPDGQPLARVDFPPFV